MKKLAYLSVSALAWGIMSSSAAMAQEQPAASNRNSDQLNDIIVTAQKREQTLQDVPVAVSVLGADALADAHINDIQKIGRAHV